MSPVSTRITDIVDRVGGGDSFGGGLIYGLEHLMPRRPRLSSSPWPLPA